MKWISDARKLMNWAFVLVAVLIIGGSLWSTRLLVHAFAEQERSRMKIWADATRALAELPESCDFAFIQEVLSENTTIPVVLTNADFEVLDARNIDLSGMSPEQCKQLALEFKAKNEPIQIHLMEGVTQYVCYDDSILLKHILYMPVVMLLVILVFVVLLVVVMLSRRRSEQNRLWVGLSRETAHQLGTPITSLLAETELIQMKYPDERLIPEMQRDVNRLRTIAERFSKIGSPSQLAEADLNAVLEGALTYMQRRVAKDADLTWNLGGPHRAMLNAPLMEWVVENLCRNAVDAMQQHGSIHFELTDHEGWVYIEVTDTGKGMTKQVADKIFRPGFTTKKRGWGLGLALVKRIVEEYHHGKIYVLRTAPGEGTTFRIELKKL
ncbi:MAG: HAMP domain-containing histidine kinase [Paludibacteraceae bacterium]|nr:HAMP domain-containing histidine kinase [Paludibacteraceae bacterium]